MSTLPEDTRPADLLANIRALAERNGWRVKVSPEMDGFPHLVIWGRGRVLMAYVLGSMDGLTNGQFVTMRSLMRAAADVRVWRPGHWREIDLLLDDGQTVVDRVTVGIDIDAAPLVGTFERAGRRVDLLLEELEEEDDRPPAEHVTRYPPEELDTVEGWPEPIHETDGPHYERPEMRS